MKKRRDLVLRLVGIILSFTSIDLFCRFSKDKKRFVFPTTVHTDSLNGTAPTPMQTSSQALSTSLPRERKSACPRYPDWDNYTLLHPPPNGTAGTTTTTNYTPTAANASWERYDKVVLVTKVHNQLYMDTLTQSICLLHAAYNRRLLYDYLIFFTIDDITQLQKDTIHNLVHPASVHWVRDSLPLQDEIALMTPGQRRSLRRRCHVNSTDQITWNHRCHDGSHSMPLAYNWMSEFRSKWIWTRPELQPYRYMMWFDADSYPMIAWREDPMKYMVQNNLVLFMGTFFGFKRGNTGVKRRIHRAYNKTICHLESNSTTGTIQVIHGFDICLAGPVKYAHGYFHITDLEFYRLPINLRWYDIFIGGDLAAGAYNASNHQNNTPKLYQREWDDQVAVVVPPAMLAPHRMASMEDVGVCLHIMHNLRVMDIYHSNAANYGGYKNYWNKEAKIYFPEAHNTCGAFVKKAG